MTNTIFFFSFYNIFAIARNIQIAKVIKKVIPERAKEREREEITNDKVE